MSPENKDMLKHAIISLFVGAVVTFFTIILEGLLGILKSGQFDFAGPISAMIYYFKGRKIVV